MNTQDLPQKLEASPAERAGRSDQAALDDAFAPNYRRLRLIGSGGMGEVYEVEHLRLGSRFAAKILRPGGRDQAARVRRFLREVRFLSRLQSDHIVRVIDVSGEERERPYYVMELLHGQDLRGLLRNHAQFPVRRALKLLFDACRGLEVAHAAGLVHRDLKPENLFVTHRDDGEELCKLLDFGVSKASEPATTEDGVMIGTVAYMAPEQVESSGTVTTRADVYALGAILYELLTGRPPHVADSVERLIFKILSGSPEPIRAVRADVPRELDAAVLRALARDPKDRFGSAGDFADALRAGVSPDVGSPATLRTRTQAEGRRLGSDHGAAAWLALGLVISSVALSDRAGHGASEAPPLSWSTPGPLRERAPQLALAAVRPRAESSHAEPTRGAPLGVNTTPPARARPRGAVGAVARERRVEEEDEPSAAPASAGVPTIRFELQNPYAKR